MVETIKQSFQFQDLAFTKKEENKRKKNQKKIVSTRQRLELRGFCGRINF